MTPTIVYRGSALASPENVVIEPTNGNLLVVNGGNNDLVEITPAGQVVATRDLAPGQAAGALFGLAITTDASGNPVSYYGNDNQNSLHKLTVLAAAAGYWLVAQGWWDLQLRIRRLLRLDRWDAPQPAHRGHGLHP